MPEGDTVWRTARRLHAGLAGQVLARAELRVPRHATAELTGRRVGEVVAHGKHLLMRLEPDLTLHSQLGMDGSWRLLGASARWPSPDEPVRAVLSTSRQLAVGRHLVGVELVATSRESDLVGHLGPDLLGPDWDAQLAVRRLAAEPGRTIGEALLDQRNLAGVGNVYRAEILFLRGLHPATPIRAAGELDRTVDLARRLLWANRDAAMRTTTGVQRRGQSLWVYDRAGRPCRRCGTTIRRGRLGPPGQERVTYWCPHCQPEPAA